MTDLLDCKGAEHKNNHHEEEQQAIKKVYRVCRGGLRFFGPDKKKRYRRNHQSVAHQSLEGPGKKLVGKNVRYYPHQQYREQIDCGEQGNDTLSNIFYSRYVTAYQ